MRYRVWHRTTYTYDENVSNSYGIAYVVPRSSAYQQVESVDVRIEPTPADTSRSTDYYGNTVTYFQVTSPHRTLVVDATSEVDVSLPVHSPAALAAPWEHARPAERPDVDQAWRAVDLSLPSTLVDQTEQARDYAAASLLPGRPVGEAVTDLMHRIHADFTYDKNATTVTSRIDDVFAQRAGVCQDFAHLTLACLRSHGLAVGYVSGYLATTPPPGRERIVGADASHAWAAVWLPDGTWLALDPTNDQWVNDRYVTVAWGRDYKDVPPVKGIIYTDAKSSTLDVQVDVAPLV
ncbi:transglutaminase family protein [Aeromicrobium duanguangcaii]|uniref:Transglutaminase family protein n=1 Tax=Aeromicrobium duanguangcaii TaxID=2968086 RepID=A0ABY5KEL3_9ACTN|nr:transglutaminase family protein [Aeromicrobium duanguangcaii]UUI67495.1 transglutaminase family protein [Aeromicrobium duanguangcaii]